MAKPDRTLMAHLLRRAGFGATFQELEHYCAKGYEATVEALLHPELQPAIEEDLLERYFTDWKECRACAATSFSGESRCTSVQWFGMASCSPFVTVLGCTE